MPEVELRLYATLRQYGPQTRLGEPLRFEFSPGTTAGDLIAQLDLPRSEVKRIFVNHRVVGDDYLLQDGDRVSLFPLVAGG